MVDRNLVAKQKFNQRMRMKRMGIDPDKNTITYGNETNNERKEPTEEERAEMERKRKEAEDQQRIARIQSLEKSIPLKQAANNLLKKTIARMKADKDLLENVGMKEETNEWKRKSIQAVIESMCIDIEEMEQGYDKEKGGLDRIKDELSELKAKEERE